MQSNNCFSRRLGKGRNQSEACSNQPRSEGVDTTNKRPAASISAALSSLEGGIFPAGWSWCDSERANDWGLPEAKNCLAAAGGAGADSEAAGRNERVANAARPSRPPHHRPHPRPPPRNVR